MHERPIKKFRPHFENLEQKRPLSAGVASTLAQPKAGSVQGGSSARAQVSSAAISVKPDFGYLVYRITNPNKYNDKLTPPFSHVLVQSNQPVPGQVYNILYVAVRNGTSKTFDASSNFQVRFPGHPNTFPILSGAEQWKPGQEFVFYVLTKKYYPLPSQVHSGYEFSLAGARSVAIPGPSGIFLRLKYNPATFAKTLDSIVATGAGAQGGKGIRFGLPDTAIYEFLSSKTDRIDFGGYF